MSDTVIGADTPRVNSSNGPFELVVDEPGVGLSWSVESHPAPGHRPMGRPQRHRDGARGESMSAGALVAIALRLLDSVTRLGAAGLPSHRAAGFDRAARTV